MTTTTSIFEFGVKWWAEDQPHKQPIEWSGRWANKWKLSVVSAGSKRLIYDELELVRDTLLINVNARNSQQTKLPKQLSYNTAKYGWSLANWTTDGKKTEICLWLGKTRSPWSSGTRTGTTKKIACDQWALIHSFKLGDPVYAWNYKPEAMWEPAYVTEVMGPWRYRTKLLNEDHLWHRH